jgi:hypothetical protein
LDEAYFTMNLWRSLNQRRSGWTWIRNKIIVFFKGQTNPKLLSDKEDGCFWSVSHPPFEHPQYIMEEADCWRVDDKDIFSLEKQKSTFFKYLTWRS